MKITFSSDKPMEFEPDFNNLTEVLMAIEDCYDRRCYMLLPQLLFEAHYWRQQLERTIEDLAEIAAGDDW